MLLWIAFILLSVVCSKANASLPIRRSEIDFTNLSTADSILVLPSVWLDLDSIEVFKNRELLKEFSHWRALDFGNRIWILQPLKESDTLLVRFSYRPIPILKSYFNHTLRELQHPSSLKDSSDRMNDFGTKTASPISENWTRLNKSGSLIRSVQVGTNQDLALESALNLQIDGRVGKNVDVIAVLSDQNTPIQPEGTTESLNELDKVFVSVRSQRLAATIGDYQLALQGGQYDALSRKLSGLMGEANYSDFSAVAAVAVSRGEYFSNAFLGQEANQGPYPLRGRNGEIGIVVLSGTEKIWLDGILMRRGEGNDYVIDYSSGEITFTSKRLITSDSRIVADFEYSNEDYEQFHGVGRAESKFLSNHITGAITYVTISDDKSRPINAALTDEEISQLELSGDNKDSALVFNADSLGENLGDYLRIDTLYNDSTYSIFVFSSRDSLGSPTGQWRVLFDDFNQGYGDYEVAADERGRTFFRWVGESQGRYRPFRRLSPAESKTMTDARFQATPLKGLTLDGEIALSSLDKNTFSTLGDRDNNGIALNSKINFVQQNMPILGLKMHRFEIDGQIRQRDKRFQEIARSSEVEFDRDWDTQNSQNIAETISEGSIRLLPISTLAFYGNYGNLDRMGMFSSDRLTLSGDYSIKQFLKTSFSHLILQSNDSTLHRRANWIRQNATVNFSVNRLSPRFSVDHERKRNTTRNGNSGFRFSDYRTGLGVSLPSQIQFDTEYRRRLDDNLKPDDSFQKASNAYSVISEASWRSESIGSILTRFSHREKSFNGLDSANITSDAGRIEALIAPRQRIVEANLIYEAAKTQSQTQILTAVQVTPRTGNYRIEGDQYIPDDQGDYILIPRNTGTYEPATELTFNSQFWLRFDEISNLQSSFLKILSTESEIILKEKTKKDLSIGLIILDQSEFRSSATLDGSASFRQDFYLNRLSSKFSVRFRYKSANALNNQFLNGGQERNTSETSIRVRARYNKFLRGETESSISKENYLYQSVAVPSRDIFRFELSEEATAAVSNRWEAGIGFSATEVSDERSQTQASLREIRPRLNYTLPGKGKIDCSFGWIHASSNRSLIPFEIARGSNRGQNFSWLLRGTYQFNQNFSGTLNYDARVDSGEKTYHTGRLEARATF